MAERRDRPRLHEERLAVRHRPLDVLRLPVVRLDLHPEVGEGELLVVGQHPCVRLAALELDADDEPPGPPTSLWVL